jgi:T5SS/PEP-CTERM-associated repeat protein
VTGSGSRWTNTSVVFGGDGGSGTLNIEGGGQVSSKSGQVGYAFGSTGRAMVTGADAIWTISDGLSVGVSGSGTLTVADGGKVTAQSVSVNDKSAVRLHVSGNDMVVLGSTWTSGSIVNNGSVGFYADSFLAAETYTPISEYAGRAMTWSGTGSYDAYGGAWDNAAKTFTVAAATALMAGATETVSTGERLLYTDPGSGKRVGASFGSITGSPTFSASPMSQTELDALALMPGFEGLVLSAWDFDTNFTGGDAVLLSFDIGPGAQDPGIWHYKDGVWGQYAADLLTYDCNGTLSFTVTDFSGYAVAAVPEPATLALLAAGAAGALLHRRRRR